MTKKSKLVLAMASMLGITAGAAAVSGFAWFTTTKSATVDITNIGVYSKSSALDIAYEANVKNTEGSVTGSTLTVKAKGAQVVETFSGDASETEFTLKQTPYANPVVSIGGTPQESGWSLTGKVITFTDAPASGTNNISVTYYPREVLTDVSSIDGQNIYKPTWTASGEGQYATAMPTADTAGAGYLSFTMRLTASGASPLEVFLNHPTITAATDADAAQQRANNAAANISRVAIIEDSTTKLVLQNDTSANNKGISSTIAGAPNWDSDGNSEADGWNLAEAGGTTTVPTATFTQTGSASKNNLSAAPAHNDPADARDNNYVTHIDAGGSKVIKVVVWLEGTSYNEDGYAYGAYASATNPINGLFSVSLPLIAF